MNADAHSLHRRINALADRVQNIELVLYRIDEMANDPDITPEAVKELLTRFVSAGYCLGAFDVTDFNT